MTNIPLYIHLYTHIYVCIYIYICTRFSVECLLSSVLRVGGQKRERSSEREGKKKGRERN